MISLLSSRHFSSAIYHNIKVSILGAAGGIGQPLSLLLKTNTRISELALYDLRGAPGVAADCNHINTPSKIHGYGPEKNGLIKTLENANIVLVPAGVPRKPGMTRDDLFVTNASIVRDLAKTIADIAPKAHLLIISNPVNSTVPIYEQIKALTNRIQFGGDEVVKAKDGAGSATLSMAYAAARFTNSLLRAIQGEANVIEPAFVETPLYLNKGCRFFSLNVELGPEGVYKAHPFGEVSTYEKELLEACYNDLQKNIEKEFKTEIPYIYIIIRFFLIPCVFVFVGDLISNYFMRFWCQCIFTEQFAVSCFRALRIAIWPKNIAEISKIQHCKIDNHKIKEYLEAEIYTSIPVFLRKYLFGFNDEIAKIKIKRICSLFESKLANKYFIFYILDLILGNIIYDMSDVTHKHIYL
ncbi:hypothetical protein PCK1_002946 [Pneumocystis canis]|nr:hypothetical protein PCK1_002946 [Pneumocystis canis]